MTDETLKLYTDLQPFFRERMGDWRLGDLFFDMVDQEYIHECYKLSDKSLLRIPLPIDPINSERGLWGMVDWTLAFANVSGDATIYIFGTEPVESLSNGWQTPELALLNTIWKQQKNIMQN